MATSKGRGYAFKWLAKFREQTRDGMPTAALLRAGRLGMDERQQILNHRWAWYRGKNYAARAVGWDGVEEMSPLDQESLASSTTLPAGFQRVGKEYPLRLRRPTVPYRLVKVIVDRFTALLFAAGQKPTIKAAHPELQELARDLVKSARLWPAMTQARTHGGAMGTACYGLTFRGGKPRVEVHDPRWVYPVFADQANNIVASYELRYPFSQIDPRGQEVWFWYRRVVDAEQDTLYRPALIGKGDEPDWEVADSRRHGLGFCPMVWTPNLPVTNSTDGDPDCEGAYELIEALDAMLSQCNRGTLANLDPTLAIKDENPNDLAGPIMKGSANALLLGPGGDASYLEINGAGIELGITLVKLFRGLALETAQCVLDHPETSGDRTATEIRRVYASMVAKADVLREQYGAGVSRAVEMMLLAAAQSHGARTTVDGVIATQRIATGLDEAKVTAALDEVRRLHAFGAELVEVTWPPAYFEATLDDTVKASTAAAGVLAAKGLDQQTVAEYLMPFFQARGRLADIMARLNSEREQEQPDSGGF